VTLLWTLQESPAAWWLGQWTRI